MFNSNFIRRDSITKYLNENFYRLPRLEFIVVELDLQNISKLNKNLVLKAISLLEIITKQKPFIKRSESVLKNKMKQKKINIKITLTLQKEKMDYFLNYLNMFILSEMKKSFFLFNNEFENKYLLNFYCFSFKNINIFKYLDSSFFNWTIPISIKFISSNNYFNMIIQKKKIN